MATLKKANLPVDKRNKRELVRTMHSVANAMPGYISSDAEEMLEKMIDAGVLQMSASGRDDDVALTQAKAALVKLMSGMIEEAARRGQDYLGENTFQDARNFFCPGLWPFC